MLDCATFLVSVTFTRRLPSIRTLLYPSLFFPNRHLSFFPHLDSYDLLLLHYCFFALFALLRDFDQTGSLSLQTHSSIRSSLSLITGIYCFNNHHAT